MMRRFYSILIVVMFSYSLSSLSQTIVKGRITDDLSSAPIENITVKAKIGKTQHVYVTGKDGTYYFSVPEKSRFTIKVTHISYVTQSRLVICDKKEIVEDFFLQIKNNDLEDVTIVALQNRVEQRNDTTVYHADAFKVHEDATAMDIMNKLPGVRVSSGDDKVLIHSQELESVMIDGKEYFNTDIPLALKNLPANVINEIQVFDKMSDYSQLIGFDDGTRKKAVNITTKRGIGESMFGKAYAGYGTDDYYHSYAMLNSFNGDMRYSLFAQCNNTCEQNFSIIDLLSTTGTAMNTAPQQSPYSKGTSDNTFHPASSNDVSSLMVGGYTAGETTSKAIGTNYSDVFGNNGNMQMSGHYLFNNAQNHTDYDIRDEYFSEGSNANLQKQTVRTDNTNHRFNMKFDWDLSSTSHLMFRPSVLYQKKSESSDLDIKEEDHDTFDVTDMMTQGQNTMQEALNTSNELMFIRRFKSTGSSISANMKLSYDNTVEDINLNLLQSNADLGSKQYTWSRNRATSVAGVASYIHTFGRYLKMRADAGWSVTYREIKRATSRSDSLSAELRTDSILSGRTTSDYGGLILGMSALYHRKHTQFVAGGEYHAYTMSSHNDITQKSFTSPVLLPFLHIRHQWGGNNNQLHFQYKTQQTYPSMQNLQDAINNTNPTLAIRGNINLKPQYTHSASVRLLLPQTDKSGIFVFFVNTEVAKDYIANKRSIAGGALGAAEKRSQMLSYTNEDGYYSTNALVAYGFPITLLKSNVNISTLVSYSHIPGYWEADLSYNKQWNWNSSLTVGSNISQDVDFVVDFNLQYLNDRNDSHPLLDVNYWTFSYGGQLNWHFCKPLKIVAECGKTTYYGLGWKDMNAIIWNMAFAYKFLHKRRGELRLSCNDLLNQNNNFTQQTNELFRRKSSSNVIGRRLMLTFTYNINTAKF